LTKLIYFDKQYTMTNAEFKAGMLTVADYLISR